MMETTPRFLSGVYPFTGQGLETPVPLGSALHYAVPADKRAQLLYFRGGNSADAMVAVMLMKDGNAMRTFPMGAKGAVHIPLVVVEDLHPDTQVDVFVAAPAGVSGQVVLDIGLMEI
jgi:hypothetical protein